MDTDLRIDLLAATAVKRARGISWAGLVAGPGAWAVSTQANYALAAPQCLEGHHSTLWIAFVLSLVSFAGGGLSLLAYLRVRAAPASGSRKPRTEVLYALLSVGTAAVFALVILLQGYAGIVFTGCER